MQICDLHFNALKERLQLLELWHLCIKTPEEAQERVAESARRLRAGKPVEGLYCPLVDVQGEICSRAVSSLGSYVAYQTPSGGQYCPLCEVKLRYDKHANRECTDPTCTIVIAPDEPSWELAWIVGSTDAALEIARRYKLAPVPS